MNNKLNTKEQASYLMELFYLNNLPIRWSRANAEECALKHIDEMIKHCPFYRRNYWRKVRSEIYNLNKYQE